MDGTLASVYRPGRTSTGPVWDALAAPLLALPRRRLRRVLILGLGAGSVARMARALAPAARIVGVERDDAVLREARRHFDLDALRTEVVVDDVLRYLRRERGTFDAVIDDIYSGTGHRVRKPEALLRAYGLVHRRVARGGVLVLNTLGDDTPRILDVLRGRPGTLVRLDVEGYHNRILALGPPALRAPALRRALGAEPLLAPSRRAVRLRTLRP